MPIIRSYFCIDWQRMPSCKSSNSATLRTVTKLTSVRGMRALRISNAVLMFFVYVAALNRSYRHQWIEMQWSTKCVTYVIFAVAAQIVTANEKRHQLPVGSELGGAQSSLHAFDENVRLIGHITTER